MARIVFALLALMAPLAIISLDASRQPLKLAGAQAIERAKTQQVIYVDINNAPAVLFYVDRRVCATADNHSMPALARCN